jgi:xanthine dehydrogenase accessory factor
MRQFFDQVAHAERRGRPFVLATVIDVGGSTPRDAGARMIIEADSTFGTIGGGAVEQYVMDAARTLLGQSGKMTEVISVHLVRDLAMCCGGKMSVFIEKVDPMPKLWIFGAGHVGTELARAAAMAHFDVAVIDERAEWADSERFPEDVSVHDEDPVDFLRQAPFDANDFVAVMTHSHPLDEEIIRALAERPLRYLGMIGSRGKWARFIPRLEARDISKEAIDRVRCPIGLDIAALTPAEIAISVTAQLIEVRRGGPKWAG